MFVDVAHRGSGTGTFLVDVALAHPDVAGVRRHALVTRDAHGLYEKFGYLGLTDEEQRMWMVRLAPT